MAINIKHPGALHRQLGIPPNDPIPMDTLEQAKAKGGTIGKRANFAINARGFKHSNPKQAVEDHMRGRRGPK